MSQATESKEILSELKAMRKDLDFIKEHIEEVFLSPDDEAALAEAEKAHKEGKTITLDELDKELGQ
jgi:hypothetical protein